LSQVDQGIYVVIDGSGSMSGVKQDVVKGINEFIKEQQDDVNGTNDVVQFSLTTFDSNILEVYVKENIELVNPVTVKDTFLGGGTALLDAVGRTLTKAQDDQAARNIVVIYTDGEENSSREFSKDDIEKLVEDLTNTGNWQFIYLGAEFADFTDDAAFAAVVGSASAGSVSSANTSKQKVGTTWSNVTQTAKYHRTATPDQYQRINSRGGLISASTEDVGIDWDAVEDENLKLESTLKDTKEDLKPIS